MSPAGKSSIGKGGGGLGGMGMQQNYANPITGASQQMMADAGEYVSQASSVREYAYNENKNRRFRPQMEDTHCIEDKLGGDPSCGLFCIFDGHGGRQVSDHCAERVPAEIRKEVAKKPSDL